MANINSKIFLLVSFLIIFIALSGCERSPDIKSTKNFNGINFSFTYPGNWKITEDVYIGNIRSITIESPGAAIVIIQDWPKKEFQYRTLKEYAYSLSVNAENETPFASISKNSFKDIETSIPSGEIKGIRETFTASAYSEDLPHIRDTFLIKSKNNIVILLTQVATEDYKMVEPGFANVLNSFNLK